MQDLFTEGGCPMTTAGDLAECACTNITMQSRLSACVQSSCAFAGQIGKLYCLASLTYKR
jgi:hypothetical protein